MNFCDEPLRIVREVEHLTVHHLVPKSQGKRRGIKGSELPTAMLCGACHRQLHVLFSNHELERRYHSIEELKREPKVKKFVAWVRKQDPNKKLRVRR